MGRSPPGARVAAPSRNHFGSSFALLAMTGQILLAPALSSNADALLQLVDEALQAFAVRLEVVGIRVEVAFELFHSAAEV